MALLAQAQEKAPPKCSVSGTVVDAVTGAPLAKVGVELRPLSRTTAPTATTQTDAAGRFALVDIDPATYTLVAHRGGYLETAYGARPRAPERGAALSLIAGIPLERLTLKIYPGGVITGIVRDPDGDLVPNAHLVLAGRYGGGGRPRIEGLHSTTADDRGVYRFRDLPPGRYYLLSEIRTGGGWSTVDHSPPGAAAPEALLPTFYPGVADISAATPIELKAGEKRDAIDVTFLRSRVFRVSGRIANPGAQRYDLTLRRKESIHDLDLHTVPKNAAGEFVFAAVAPGAYLLEAGVAAVPVEVGYGDVENVRITVGVSAEVRGRVVIDGEPGAKIERMQIEFARDGRQMIGGSPGADGSFKGLPGAGLCDVKISHLPANLYVKSIRSGERDVFADGLDVPASGVLPLDIVLGADGAKVGGGVSDPEARPATAATVALVPARRERIDLYRSALTDQNGRYTLDAAAPGDYKLFAWGDVEDGDWLDPEFLKKYESQGVEVKLESRDTKSVDVKTARDK